MKALKNILIVVPALLMLPRPAEAYYCSGNINNFGDVVCFFTDLIATAIPVVAGIALLVFFYGLGKFILNAGSDSGRDEGKQVMKWGIISLFVLVSIWGIVAFLSGDILGEYFIGIPQLPISS